MKILIHGDSWGCGVWENEKNVHRGLELYLKEKGHSVQNYSIGGHSNYEVYKSLSKLNLKFYDFIFVFYTNPLRDLISDDINSQYFNVPNKSLTYNDYTEIYKNLAINYLKLLDSFKKPIHIIGGQNKLNINLYSPKYLVYYIQSMREKFYPDFVEEEVMCASTVFNRFARKFDLEALDKIAENRKYIDHLITTQKEYFYPDGGHLNYNGHKILAEEIHSYMLEKKQAI